MAAITSINAVQQGAFSAPVSTLTADDTITFTPARKQLLVLSNTTAGELTATLDGAAGTTVYAQGIGPVSVAAGLAIDVPAGECRAVVLGTVSAYCQGVVHLTGGAGIEAQLFDL
ncbi:hypothetical protein N0K08_17380 [Acidovorax sp. Be4]|uniref:Uncharacterized protein n=1 Tax=Acidovorax bellezanensis TaxID=2976702 RepID=A0ABT2PQC0_9BURK|nr:hypothetical protein [Acidovorax sp. Be4]MCT9812418.1 hypothetical protein [Acidovorax sp. Be4]